MIKKHDKIKKIAENKNLYSLQIHLDLKFFYPHAVERNISKIRW